MPPWQAGKSLNAFTCPDESDTGDRPAVGKVSSIFTRRLEAALGQNQEQKHTALAL
jgi:hypothetical protein